VRFPRIVSEVFPKDANDLDRRNSTRQAGHPVPSRDIQQLPIHQEAIGKACHPAEASSVSLDASSVFVPFTVYAGADFQKVAARSADVRLLRCALGARVGTRTNEEKSKQYRNKKYAHGSLPSTARFYV